MKTNPTMATGMAPTNQQLDIPGNPSVAKSAVDKLNDGTSGRPLRALTEEEFQFWKYNGYVVIKGAISKEQAQQTADAVWEFEEKSPTDPSTWYTPPRAEMEMKELIGSGMVEMYNHPLMWQN